MTRNKSENRIIDIKPEFDSILVCNDRRLQPYIEIIIQEPENITSQNLGTLIGVLEVNDDSEDSSYIVNYLISVIKKEYFSKPKRGPIESLESALHKANLALSGLAEHGNINWLGKLSALIAVTEKNNLHLSQAGDATALLLRSKTLTDVSDGLAPTGTEPNPLKTFVSVSSGRLEKNDKLIISTAGIFDIFSLEELKKSSLRFSNEEFIQFLRTALSNELPKAAVLIADLQDQEEITPVAVKKTPKEVNVFSSDAFNDKSIVKKELQEKIAIEIQKEIQETSSEFTDEKTGHIYIKEDLSAPTPESAGINYLEIFFEKLTDLSGNLGDFFINTLWRKIKSLRLPPLPKFNFTKSEKPKGSPTERQSDFQPMDEAINQPIENQPSKLTIFAKNFLSRIIQLAKMPFTQERLSALSTISKKLFFKTARLVSILLSQKNKDLALKMSKLAYRKSLSGLLLIIPDFEKIKKNTHKMDYQQRLYTILILVLIFIVPLIGLKIRNSFTKEKPAPVIIERPPIIIPLAQDKNVVRIDTLNSLYSGSNIIKTLNLNNKIFTITANAVIDLEKNKTSPLPADFGTPKYAVSMQDLNFIFLLNGNNRLISFSPISSTFQNNNLSVPTNSDIRAIGTYLTYVYLIDAKNNQIYRYPRAADGFGPATNWLKDSISLSESTELGINDNVFIANRSNILKLFSGKTQEFTLEKTATPINIASLTIGESGNIFILDKQNSRVISLNADGTIITQYHNLEINSANNLTVNEENKTIYITSPSSVRTLPIN